MHSLLSFALILRVALFLCLQADFLSCSELIRSPSQLWPGFSINYMGGGGALSVGFSGHDTATYPCFHFHFISRAKPAKSAS